MNRLLQTTAAAFLFPIMSSMAADFAIVSPASFDFGPIRLGSTAKATSTVQNTSAATITVSSSAPAGSEFSVTDDCFVPLVTGETCRITATFRPGSRDDYVGAANLIISDGNSVQNVDVSLTGAGIGGIVEVYPASLNFGISTLNETTTVPITFVNTHSTPVTLGLSSGDNGDFTPQSNCPATLASGNSCTYDVAFTPTRAGAHEETFDQSVTASGIEERIQISLQGTGEGFVSEERIARVWPTEIGFGEIRRGTTVTVSMMISNRTFGSLINFASGDPQGAYSKNADCEDQVSVGGSCRYDFSFTADQSNSSVGFPITFSSTTGGSQTVRPSLSGQATGRMGQVSPVGIDFGTLPVDATGRTSISVRNTSDQTITGLIASWPDFPFSGGVPSGCRNDLIVGEECTIDVAFAPQFASNFTDKLIIGYTSASGLTELVEIELNGLGTDDLIFRDGWEIL